MAATNVILAVIVASTLLGSPEQEPVAAQPQPAAAQPDAQPAPAPTVQPTTGYETQPAATAQPATQAQPSYPPQPSGPVPLQPQQTGLGMMIAGPLTVAIGIPFSFLGNYAWRENCGPDSSNRRCADGTLGSIGAHTVTGVAYAAGISFTGIGAARRARFDAAQDPTRSGTGMIIGGALLLPASLISMGLVRLTLWLPTPDCQTYDCVERYQNISTVVVGGLALTASMGAGLLMYGASYNRSKPKQLVPIAVLPQAGRGYAGLSLTGRF